MSRIPYRFLLRGVIAITPVIVFILSAEAFLWLSGETVPIRTMATRHLPGGPASAYLPGLMGQQFNLLHYERVKVLRPKLLILGSSRVTRFRWEMFGSDSGFYNSGRTISCVGDLEEYVRALPKDYAPRALLLGIDSWWFKPSLTTPPRFARDVAKDDTKNISAHVYAYRKIFHAIRRGHLTWDLFVKILTRQDGGVKRYGLIAWKSSGMRNDGSNRTFDRTTPKAYPDMLPEEITEILKISHPALIPATEADDGLLCRLVAVVKEFEERGTIVVAFAPPFASEVQEAYDENPMHYGFYADYKQKITRIFKENNWYFFDGSSLAALGLDDRVMKDRDHAQETYHVALLNTMAKEPKVRDALRLNPEYLQALLADPDTTLWYPDYSPQRKQ